MSEEKCACGAPWVNGCTNLAAVYSNNTVEFAPFFGNWVSAKDHEALKLELAAVKDELARAKLKIVELMPRIVPRADVTFIPAGA